MRKETACLTLYDSSALLTLDEASSILNENTKLEILDGFAIWQ